MRARTDYDSGRSVQVAGDGGYIVTGGAGSFGAGREDVYLVKVDGARAGFLTLPFKDPDIKIQEGWIYTWDPDPDAHKGIDYIKGDVDDSNTWQSFDVVAAADGARARQTV